MNETNNSKSFFNIKTYMISLALKLGKLLKVMKDMEAKNQITIRCCCWKLKASRFLKRKGDKRLLFGNLNPVVLELSFWLPYFSVTTVCRVNKININKCKAAWTCLRCIVKSLFLNWSSVLKKQTSLEKEHILVKF